MNREEYLFYSVIVLCEVTLDLGNSGRKSGKANIVPGIKRHWFKSHLFVTLENSQLHFIPLSINEERLDEMDSGVPSIIYQIKMTSSLGHKGLSAAIRKPFERPAEIIYFRKGRKFCSKQEKLWTPD